MRYLVVFSVFFIMLFGSISTSVAAQDKEMKIATVDLQKALNEVDAGKRAKADLQKKFEKKKKELEILKQEADKKRMKYERQKTVASPSELRKQEDELKKLFLNLQQEMQSAQRSFAQQEMEITSDMLEGLKEIVKEIAEEEKFQFVFEGENSLLYAPGVVDLTEDVIKKYNKTHKGKK